MNYQNTDNRMRLGMASLVVCCLAAFVAGFGAGRMSKKEPSSSSPSVEASAADSLATSGEAPPASVRKPARSAQPPAAGAEPAAPAPPQRVTMEQLANLWGIHVSSIGLDMNGAAVSVTYTVLDPDKATRLSDDTIPAFLIEQSSGKEIPLKASSPMGSVSSHSRARSVALAGQQSWAFPPPRNKLFAGQEYSFLVSNPEKSVKSGTKLALVVGNYQTGGLTVQ